MSTERLDAEIKTRVPETAKAALEQQAADRHLALADIVREAIREYLAKREAEKKSLAEQTKAA